MSAQRTGAHRPHDAAARRAPRSRIRRGGGPHPSAGRNHQGGLPRARRPIWPIRCTERWRSRISCPTIGPGVSCPASIRGRARSPHSSGTTLPTRTRSAFRWWIETAIPCRSSIRSSTASAAASTCRVAACFCTIGACRSASHPDIRTASRPGKRPVAHDHSGHGDEKRQGRDAVRRDGRSLSGDRPRQFPLQRLRSGARSRRRRRTPPGASRRTACCSSNPPCRPGPSPNSSGVGMRSKSRQRLSAAARPS